MQINNQGHLEIGGCDVVGLADTFGTPLIIIDELCSRIAGGTIKPLLRMMVMGFSMPSKAFLATACRIIHEEGIGPMLFPEGVTIALAAGFPPEDIFHGNNKSAEELNCAQLGVGRIVIDKPL